MAVEKSGLNQKRSAPYSIQLNLTDTKNKNTAPKLSNESDSSKGSDDYSTNLNINTANAPDKPKTEKKDEKKEYPSFIQQIMVNKDPQSIKKIKNPTEFAMQIAANAGVSIDDMPGADDEDDVDDVSKADDNDEYAEVDASDEDDDKKAFPDFVQQVMVNKNPESIKKIKNPTEFAMQIAANAGVSVDDMPEKKTEKKK